MQGGTYPGGALPAPTSRTPIIAALIALVVGGAIATGIWWLTDNDVSLLPEADTATKVIVAQPGTAGAGTAVKDEASVAATLGGNAIAVNPSTGQAVVTKDEAATAAAIGNGKVEVDPSTGFQLRGSKASQSSEPQALHAPGQGVQP